MNAERRLTIPRMREIASETAETMSASLIELERMLVEPTEKEIIAALMDLNLRRPRN